MKKPFPIQILVIMLWTVSTMGSEPAGVRIRAVGDIMLGTMTPEGFLRPEEKGSILQYIRPLLQDADITLGNLEGTLCDSGSTDKCEPDSLDCYLFRMPETYGGDLKMSGFDLLSLANNHTGDFGPECLERTEQILDSLNIGWSGRPGSYATLNVDDVKVAFIAFHSGGNCNNSLDLPYVQDLISAVDEKHDIIIVSVHGGAEGLAAMTMPDTMEYYMGEERGNMRQFAHTAIDAGADLIIGHGPHIARPAEIYRGKVIVYSLGNFATYGRFNLQADRRFGGILEVVLTGTGNLVSGRLIATEQKYWGVPFWDPNRRFVHLVDSLSRADINSSRIRFNKSGIIQLP